MPARRTASRTACPESTGASVSLKAPRKALPMGVRAVETITASRTVGTPSEIQPAQGIGDAHRLVDPLGLDAHADLHLHRPAAQVLDAEDLGARTHARADLERRREAHPVAAVVDAVLHALGARQVGQEV